MIYQNNNLLTKEDYLERYNYKGTGLLNFLEIEELHLKDTNYKQLITKLLKLPSSGIVKVNKFLLDDFDEMEKLNALFDAGLLLVKVKNINNIIKRDNND